MLERFLGWVWDLGLEPYPAQEEAFLEVMGDRHLILSTPTGSGKSLVAAALVFRALCEGERAFYTCPIKALVSEKFFWLCEELGAERVGMLTGDASINRDAPVICCTAEVLANMALREGSALDVPCVVMDEFHYYADRDRGHAWQVPLLRLPRTRFLLMSATLGDTREIEDRIRARTGREVARVHSELRPVPLDFEYRETVLPQTVESLLERDLAPIYIVHFTQRECAEQAQGLTGARICDRGERSAIARAIGEFRFASPYGKDVRRFLQAGIGIHHAGLLPRYRLLVERLAQKGLLKVICGTDTLGVGVNIPIRTVLFTQLSKFDGEKVALLRVRDFKQIAGRAGRKGFDDRGAVVCQAPAFSIEKRRRGKPARTPRGRPDRPGRPVRPRIAWNRETFQRLVHQPPEPLESRFKLTHGMLVSLLQAEADRGEPGYRALVDLVEASHETARRKERLRRDAAELFRALRRAEIVEVVRLPGRAGARARVRTDLQFDFSLHHTLSLYLVEAVEALDPLSPDFALDVLSAVEAILENPRAILLQQVHRLKRDRLAELKAERVPFEDRIAQLDEITHPQPCAEFLHATFDLFAQHHPWVGHEDIHPKSIAREMYEGYHDFDGYVRHYELQRMEGLLLRYLSQVCNALARSVPEAVKTEAFHDVLAFLRSLVGGIDSSLVESWEALVAPEREPAPGTAPAPPEPLDLARHPRLLRGRIRAEIHRLVAALAAGNYAAAEALVLQVQTDYWSARRFEQALRPLVEECGGIVFTPRARLAEHTSVLPDGPRRWRVQQVLLDRADENLWALVGGVELPPGPAPETPLLRLHRIGP